MCVKELNWCENLYCWWSKLSDVMWMQN